MKKFYTTVEGRTFLILDGTRAYYTTDPKETEGVEEKEHIMRAFKPAKFTEAVPLPTIKELKAEKRWRVNNKDTAYSLAPYFVVSIDFLIEALTRFPKAKGYWTGNIVSHGADKKVADLGLCLKDDNGNMLGIILSMSTETEYVEVKHDTLAGIVPNSKAICKFADSIEWYEGYLYAVHKYTVIRIPCEKKFEGKEGKYVVDKKGNYVGEVGADFAGMFEAAKNDITIVDFKVDKSITRLIGKAELISIDSQGRTYIKAEKGEACIC